MVIPPWRVGTRGCHQSVEPGPDWTWRGPGGRRRPCYCSSAKSTGCPKRDRPRRTSGWSEEFVDRVTELSQQSSTSSSPQENRQDAELQIILAEYNYQHQLLHSSTEGVGRTLNLYLGVLAFLAAIATGGLAFIPAQTNYSLLIFGLLTGIAALASFFTFVQSYQTRIEKTKAELALCRLRNYFKDNHPELHIYLSGPLHDDWNTPYTNRWRSASFWGWITLSVATGFLSTVSILSFALGVDLTSSSWLWLVAACVIGPCVIVLNYLWLDRRLNYEAKHHQARFKGLADMAQESTKD